MRRVRVKPSKGMSLLGLVVGIIMLVLGVSGGIPVSRGSGVFWVFLIVVIIGCHAFNVFSDRGVATQEIDVEGFEPDSPTENNAADRLERLKRLRTKNLINEDEYRKKRAEIIKRL